ncbi:MAG: hypothetical protein FWD06_10530 [Oscillospiraceae bacterium]|nr:hypothetical protein [Oscillospiraceae bacterium]
MRNWREIAVNCKANKVAKLQRKLALAQESLRASQLVLNLSLDEASLALKTPLGKVKATACREHGVRVRTKRK